MNWIERDEDGDGHDIGLNLTLELKCPSQKLPQPKPSLDDIAFQSSSASKHNSFQGANMNKTITVIATEPAVSLSPYSTISSANGKRSEREENVSERPSTSSEGGCDDDSSTRKKLRLTKEQSAILEETFKHQCTLNQSQKMALARQLSLQTRQVEVWFQNRRARTKFKKTEVDCAFLKRRSEDLAEENRLLQKEVAELRALKYSANTKPATTLTMCPQCERLGKVPKSSPIAPEPKTTTANWLINRL